MIRRALPEDADAIAETFIASLETLTFLPTLHTHDEHRRFINEVVPRDHEIWVAEDEGRAVGFDAPVLKPACVNIRFDLASPRDRTCFGLKRRAGSERFSAHSHLPLTLTPSDNGGHSPSTSLYDDRVSQICLIWEARLDVRAVRV